MADEDITIRLKSEGAEEATKLRARLAELEAEVKDLNGAMDRGSISGTRYRDELSRLTSDQLRLNRQLGSMSGEAEKAAKSFGNMGNKLMLAGQFIDDLQYVAEQGLRPIAGQLVQINPLLGIFAIGASIAYKNADQLKNAGKGLSEYYGLDKMTTQAGGLAGALKSVAEVAAGLPKAFQEAAEGWDALTGGKAIREKASIEAFRAEGTPENKARGAAAAGAFDTYGRGNALDEMVSQRAKLDPRLRGPDAEAARRQEQATILALLEGAKKGDEGDILGLKQRAEGTRFGKMLDEAVRTQEQKKDRASDAEFAADRDAASADAGKQMINRLSGSILKGPKDPGNASSVDWHTQQLKQQAKAMLKQLNPGQVIDSAMIDQVIAEGREQLERQINEYMVKEGVSRDEATRKVGRDHRTASQVQRDEVRDRFKAQRRQENEAKRAADTQAAAGREADFEQRAVEASGATPFIAQLMMQARQQAAQKDFIRSRTSVGAQRKYLNMTDEEAEATQGQRNDQTDEQLTKGITRSLLRGQIYNPNTGRRFTGGRLKANAIASRMVQDARKLTNATTGDPATERADKQTKAIEDNTKMLAEFKRTGVRVVMS